MSSIVYEITKNCPKFQESYLKAHKGIVPSTNTVVQYKNNAVRAARWMKSTYGCGRYDQMKAHAVEYISGYSQYLQKKKLSASTIHTYLAGICYALDVPLDKIKKPSRNTYKNTRSRGIKAVDTRRDASREASTRFYDFARMVGIRRSEYQALRGNNLKTDESGHLCVEVLKGKGGKYQLQRILPEYEDAVRAYFDGSDNYVFTKQELKNKIDIHHIRDVVAQDAYRYYETRLRNEPDYANVLTSEIERRWSLYRNRDNPEKLPKSRIWSDDLVKGTYKLRGANLRTAKKQGLPAQYDRLILMAVSVFHLSHWRCDVTVNNYILAR